MGVFKLVEYKPGSSGYEATGKTFSFEPLPKLVKKDVKLELRVRNHGLRWFKLVRFRNRLTETYDISGRTSVYKILELQHFLKRQGRDAKVKFKIQTDIDALKVMKESWVENNVIKPENPTLAGSGSPWLSDNFFIIKDFKTNIPSGKTLGTFDANDKTLCVDYTLKLELVEE